jgi:hypothetical protein
MHQYALLNKGSTIHSLCQFEWYKNDVNNKSINVPGGLQCIQTLDGYIIQLNIKDGLAHLSNHQYTDHTSELEWDPSVLDHDLREDEQWGEVPAIESSFDEIGDCKHHGIVQHLAYFQCHNGDLPSASTSLHAGLMLNAQFVNAIDWMQMKLRGNNKEKEHPYRTPQYWVNSIFVDANESEVASYSLDLKMILNLQVSFIIANVEKSVALFLVFSIACLGCMSGHEKQCCTHFSFDYRAIMQLLCHKDGSYTNS